MEAQEKLLTEFCTPLGLQGILLYDGAKDAYVAIIADPARHILSCVSHKNPDRAVEEAVNALGKTRAPISLMPSPAFYGPLAPPLASLEGIIMSTSGLKWRVGDVIAFTGAHGLQTGRVLGFSKLQPGIYVQCTDGYAYLSGENIEKTFQAAPHPCPKCAGKVVFSLQDVRKWWGVCTRCALGFVTRTPGMIPPTGNQTYCPEEEE